MIKLLSLCDIHFVLMQKRKDLEAEESQKEWQ